MPNVGKPPPGSALSKAPAGARLAQAPRVADVHCGPPVASVTDVRRDAQLSVVADAVESAEADAGPFEVLRTTVRALCAVHSPDQQEIGRSIDLLVAATPELQERTAFKRAAITAALEAALAARLGERHLAGMLADIGMRAYYGGFASWIRTGPDARLEDVVLDELDALDAALSDRPWMCPQQRHSR